MKKKNLWLAVLSSTLLVCGTAGVGLNAFASRSFEIVRAAAATATSVGFESGAGFTAGTSYQGNVTAGSTGSQWKIYYGNVTTSSAITGSQSVGLRLYTSSNYGYLYNNYDVSNVSKVSYKAKAATTNSAKILLNTFYSTDSGTTWVAVDENKEISSTATEYSFDIPSAAQSSIRVKFAISSSSTKPTKSNAQLTIDDVTFTHPGTSGKNTVQFDANGGTFADGKGTQVEFDEGSTTSVTLPTASDLSATPYGYSVLKCWTDGTTEYLPGATVTNISADISFKAVYVGTTLTIAQAKALAESVGSKATTVDFTTVGYVSKIVDAYSSTYKNVTVMISDGTDSIKCYHLVGASDSVDASTLKVGDHISVTGALKTYSGEQEYDACSYVSAGDDTRFTVSFESNGGSAVASIFAEGGKVISKPGNPTKDGFDFKGWYKESSLTTSWDFETDTVVADTVLYAKWVSNSYGSLFEQLNAKANLSFSYSATANYVFNDDFRVVSSSKSYDLPDGWSSEDNKFGGTYPGTSYQSFRDSGQYVKSPTFETVSSIEVSMDYYLNNYGTSGSKSSKIKIEALGTDDSVVQEWTSKELNTSSSDTGIDSVHTLKAVLKGTGIVSVKVSMIKNGGGNIAFSTIKGTTTEYSLDKDDNGKNKLEMNFAGIMPNDVYEGLKNCELGVVYMTQSALTAEGATFEEMLDLAKTDGISTVKSVYSSFKSVVCSKTTQCDADGKTASTGAYTKFGLSIGNISTAKINEVVYAAPYTIENNKIYFMGTKSCSVKTLAASYVADGVDTSSYVDHIGAIDWLASL